MYQDRDLKSLDQVRQGRTADKPTVSRILRKAGGPWFARERPEHPGHWVFQSTEVIRAGHVCDLAKAMATADINYTVLINGGTHGSKDGSHAGDPGSESKQFGEYKFVQEDMDTVKNITGMESTLHVVSRLAGPIYPKNISFVINAWCFSDGKGKIQPGTVDPVLRPKPKIAKFVRAGTYVAEEKQFAGCLGVGAWVGGHAMYNATTDDVMVTIDVSISTFGIRKATRYTYGAALELAGDPFASPPDIRMKGNSELLQEFQKWKVRPDGGYKCRLEMNPKILFTNDHKTATFSFTIVYADGTETGILLPFRFRPR